MLSSYRISGSETLPTDEVIWKYLLCTSDFQIWMRSLSSGCWRSEGHFLLSNKLSNDHIQKWHIIYGLAYTELRDLGCGYGYLKGKCCWYVFFLCSSVNEYCEFIHENLRKDWCVGWSQPTNTAFSGAPFFFIDNSFSSSLPW